jgi:hypothetical protein
MTTTTTNTNNSKREESVEVLANSMGGRLDVSNTWNPRYLEVVAVSAWPFGQFQAWQAWHSRYSLRSALKRLRTLGVAVRMARDVASVAISALPMCSAELVAGSLGGRPECSRCGRRGIRRGASQRWLQTRWAASRAAADVAGVALSAFGSLHGAAQANSLRGHLGGSGRDKRCIFGTPYGDAQRWWRSV